METIRRWLNALSRNRVAQVVIIGWSFQFLIEGASGFGTPAALAGPLVGLGFPPLRVAMACLILNSVPVSFGFVGTPTWFGFASLKLSPGELHAVAWKTAAVHSAAACVVPFMAFRLLLSWQEIRRNLLFICLAIAASVVPMMLLALMNDEFPSVAGGMIGLLVTVWLARHRVGLVDDHFAAEEIPSTSAQSVVKAMFSLWVLNAPRGTAWQVWHQSISRMTNPLLALLGALVLVKLLMTGDDASSVMIAGRSLAAATGDGWQYFAAYLGAIGAFFAGSCTISNLTFGPIQDSIASQVGQDRTTILALQSVGAAMGNMVAIHHIVAVGSVLGLTNQEGKILRQTVGPMLIYGAIAAVAALSFV